MKPNRAQWILALFYIFAGLNHFRSPREYERIMPPMLPAPLFLVYLSGVAEIAGGAGVLPPQTRKLAGYGLIALLIAIYPANIYALKSGLKFGDTEVPQWALWARLPLQIPLIWWAWRVAIAPESQKD